MGSDGQEDAGIMLALHCYDEEIDRCCCVTQTLDLVLELNPS